MGRAAALATLDRPRHCRPQAAGLRGLDGGQKVTHEVVRERGEEAAADLRVG